MRPFWRRAMAASFALTIVGLAILLAPYVSRSFTDPQAPNRATFLGAVLGGLGIAGILVSAIKWAVGPRSTDDLMQVMRPTLNEALGDRLQVLRMGSIESLPISFWGHKGRRQMFVRDLAAAAIEPSARVVLIGPSGSGKTYAATELALHLNNTGDPAVAVVIPAHRWGTTQSSMHDWLVRYMERELNISQRSASRLLTNGMVIPIFDGLDELATRPGEPPRASLENLLDRLLEWEEAGRRASFVVTSQPSAITPLPPRLRDNYSLSRYDWMPNSREEIETYAARRLTGVNQAPVTAALYPILVPDEANPVLRRPWRISTMVELAKEWAVASGGVDDALLRRLRAIDTDRQLVMAYVEQTVRSRKRAVERLRGSIDLWRLGNYASFLRRNIDEPSKLKGRWMPVRDLELHRLWPIAGVWRPRLIDAALCILLSVPGFVWLFPFLWPFGWVARSVLLFACLAWVGMLVRTSTKAWVPAAMPDYGRLKQVKFLVPQLAAATVIGIFGWLFFSVVIGAACFVTAWLVIGLTVGFGQTLATDSQLTVVGAYGTLRHERRVSELAAWIVFPILLLGFSRTYGFRNGAIGAGIYCLVVGETVASALWRRYVATIITSPIKLSLAPYRLFERARQSGLMRVSSLAYQFRHDEIRDFLAERSAGPLSLARSRNSPAAIEEDS